jgi:hypothetical protein
LQPLGGSLLLQCLSGTAGGIGEALDFGAGGHGNFLGLLLCLFGLLLGLLCSAGGVLSGEFLGRGLRPGYLLCELHGFLSYLLGRACCLLGLLLRLGSGELLCGLLRKLGCLLSLLGCLLRCLLGCLLCLGRLFRISLLRALLGRGGLLRGLLGCLLRGLGGLSCSLRALCSGHGLLR